MKKHFLLLVLFAVIGAVSVQAQDYKPFRVGLGLGFASPSGEGAKGGVLFYAEPSYRVTDAIAVGLKGEIAVMLRGGTSTTNGQTTNVSGKVAAAGSWTVNGQYYFMSGGFRPFAGLGFGIYRLASASFSASSGGSSSSTGEVASGSKFGFYPRLGFDAGHFTLNLEYNIIGATKSVVVNSGTTTTSETKNGYLGFRVGFFIGGGKKK
jgi:outer membrane protein W